MATLITAHDGAGRLLGRCDASCHLAKLPRCNCVCNSRFHGRGEVFAFQRIKDNPGAFQRFLENNSYTLTPGKTVRQEAMTL